MVGFAAGYRKVIPDANFFRRRRPCGANRQHILSEGGAHHRHAISYGAPEVNLFFHTDKGIEGVGDVIQNLKIQGKVYASGFNVSSAILDAIKKGVTLVTIDQNYAAQTNAGTQQCVRFLTKGEARANPINHIDPVVITAAGGDGGLDAETALKQLESSK